MHTYIPNTTAFVGLLHPLLKIIYTYLLAAPHGARLPHPAAAPLPSRAPPGGGPPAARSGPQHPMTPIGLYRVAGFYI